MPYATPYLILINAAALLLMHMDKRNAIRRGPRVPEVILIGIALMGGSLGALIGMFACRHKTRKLRFSVGLPLILLVQIGFLLFMNL